MLKADIVLSFHLSGVLFVGFSLSPFLSVISFFCLHLLLIILQDFQPDQKVTKRNDHTQRSNAWDVPVAMSKMFPVHVMARSVISGEGGFVPLFLFEYIIIVINNTYNYIMDTVVRAWVKGTTGDLHYI